MFVRFSILVNGTLSCFFSNSCGLRQGDPFSPLHFVIVMEALRRMISWAAWGGTLEEY